MKRMIFAAALLCLTAIPTFAQEWAADAIGGTEYNCNLVQRIIGDSGDAVYLLQDGEPVTVEDMILRLASGCTTAPDSSSDLALKELRRSWPFIYYDENTYQCETVHDIIAAYGNYEFQRYDDDAMTVFTYHQKKSPYCVPRYVIASKKIRLRECLDRPCETDQYMQRGEALPVIDKVVDGEEIWYEVAREFKHYLSVEAQDETAFVNAANIVFGPAGFVELDGSYYILHESYTPHCQVYPRREDAPFVHLSFIKAGEAYKDMLVDLIAPLTESPMPIKDEPERAFTNSGEPYIHQLYESMIIAKATGIFTIDLKLDGIIYRLGFDLAEPGIYRFHIHCK